MTTSRILLIDDRAMFRSGLRMALNASLPGTEVFEADTLNEAIQRKQFELAPLIF